MNDKLKQTYLDLRATFPEWGASKTIGIARSALAMYEEARERLLTQRAADECLLCGGTGVIYTYDYAMKCRCQKGTRR